MRGKEMFIPCDRCDHPSFCKEHGCTIWNDEARRIFEAYGRIHQDQIDRWFLGRPTKLSGWCGS